MRFYFDACCLNRLTDDQSQPRIAREAEAIERLLIFATEVPNTFISSFALRAEIARNPFPNRRQDAEEILMRSDETVSLNGQIIERARRLLAAGFAEFDALHLACSEHAGIDVFLTTDDRLIRRARRGVGRLPFRVLNPITFIQELLDGNAIHD